MSKGNLHHLFNTLEHQHYVAPCPTETITFPEPCLRPPKQSLMRDTWAVESECGALFSRRTVTYLLIGHKTSHEHWTLCPIWSLWTEDDCLILQRSAWNALLVNEHVATMPLTGWCGRHVNQSSLALEWLAWMEHSSGQDGADRIMQVYNDSEKRIPSTWCTVDRFDQITQNVHEFDGCFWHGCPNC